MNLLDPSPVPLLLSHSSCPLKVLQDVQHFAEGTVGKEGELCLFDLFLQKLLDRFRIYSASAYVFISLGTLPIPLGEL